MHLIGSNEDNWLRSIQCLLKHTVFNPLTTYQMRFEMNEHLIRKSVSARGYDINTNTETMLETTRLINFDKKERKIPRV